MTKLDPVYHKHLKVREKVDKLLDQIFEKHLTLEEAMVFYFHLEESSQVKECRGSYNEWCCYMLAVVTDSIQRRIGINYSDRN